MNGRKWEWGWDRACSCGTYVPYVRSHMERGYLGGRISLSLSFGTRPILFSSNKLPLFLLFFFPFSAWRESFLGPLLLVSPSVPFSSFNYSGGWARGRKRGSPSLPPAPFCGSCSSQNFPSLRGITLTSETAPILLLPIPTEVTRLGEKAGPFERREKIWGVFRLHEGRGY